MTFYLLGFFVVVVWLVGVFFCRAVMFVQIWRVSSMQEMQAKYRKKTPLALGFEFPTFYKPRQVLC